MPELANKTADLISIMATLKNIIEIQMQLLFAFLCFYIRPSRLLLFSCTILVISGFFVIIYANDSTHLNFLIAYIIAEIFAGGN